ncbi:hypothetical protein ATB96_17740 [Elizabethkingia ursingii]|nr:hypothetical protein ATB96_17740 [Elizabethkingia ursingii]
MWIAIVENKFIKYKVPFRKLSCSWFDLIYIFIIIYNAISTIQQSILFNIFNISLLYIDYYLFLFVELYNITLH